MQDLTHRERLALGDLTLTVYLQGVRADGEPAHCYMAIKGDGFEKLVRRLEKKNEIADLSDYGAVLVYTDELDFGSRTLAQMLLGFGEQAVNVIVQDT